MLANGGVVIGVQLVRERASNSRQWTLLSDSVLLCLSSSSSSDPMPHILHIPATVSEFSLLHSSTHSAMSAFIPARTSQSICVTRSTSSRSRITPLVRKNQGKFISIAKVSNAVDYFRGQEALRPTSDEGSRVLQSTKKIENKPKIPRTNVGALEEDLNFETEYAYQTPIEAVHASTQ